ncbi:protein phosphatase 2C domain-containing protein [Brachybacterium sp. MASK1Z-5]|uniref:Protein phosphatase 2C domain-containing protein n=1 Tax=Brachybacterium halotolerans TaxID=2795215 RepID=A0ABS1BAU5_9MICO|nr:MerR family transcriptional regulator [Brachybacterium halotolerans]MBK0331755.1 protein phosphatase 2C domain-containing protein [Brachybacterium halotolerans]
MGTDGRDARGRIAPEDFLGIGELARRSGLSPKALRLYDASDLLPPRHVDPFTGYRRYGADQVGRALLIARLRGLGMGLERIRVICDLPADAAGQELRSWWLQEQADARTRSTEVASLLTDLRTLPTEESPMTTDHTERTAHTGHPAHPAHPAHPDERSATASAAVRIAHVLEQGGVRATQQDAVHVQDLPGGRLLLAIADGFGADDDLSGRLLDALGEGLRTALDSGADGPPASDVLAALESAWAALPDLLPADGASGAALLAAVLDGKRLVLAHLGDGRALLVREGHVEPLTRDHTQVASLVAAGRLTEEEAAADPRRAVLNRALAAGAPTAPDLIVRTLIAGDRLVLTSDGIHAVLTPEALGESLLAGSSSERTVQDIARRTLEAGAPDNLAAIVADLG